MKENYECPVSEEIRVQVENNIMSGEVVGPDPQEPD
jgi:hypothetical protein